MCRINPTAHSGQDQDPSNETIVVTACHLQEAVTIHNDPVLPGLAVGDPNINVLLGCGSITEEIIWTLQKATISHPSWMHATTKKKEDGGKREMHVRSPA